MDILTRSFWIKWRSEIVILHALSCWFMVGLIWTIHAVHYPLFADVGSQNYAQFQAHHVERIGKLLLVPWALEGITAVLLIVVIPKKQKMLVIAGAILMAGILVLSGLVSAPAHAELADGFNESVHSQLMNANLARTLLWTMRGVIAGSLLFTTFTQKSTLKIERAS
ncbi:MAG: hypothetical protein ACKVKP_01745 [Acidimicrobiales bacterium]